MVAMALPQGPVRWFIVVIFVSHVSHLFALTTLRGNGNDLTGTERNLYATSKFGMKLKKSRFGAATSIVSTGKAKITLNNNKALVGAEIYDPGTQNSVPCNAKPCDIKTKAAVVVGKIPIVPCENCKTKAAIVPEEQTGQSVQSVATTTVPLLQQQPLASTTDPPQATAVEDLIRSR